MKGLGRDGTHLGVPSCLPEGGGRSEDQASPRPQRGQWAAGASASGADSDRTSSR